MKKDKAHHQLTSTGCRQQWRPTIKFSSKPLRTTAVKKNGRPPSAYVKKKDGEPSHIVSVIMRVIDGDLSNLT